MYVWLLDIPPLPTPCKRRAPYHRNAGTLNILMYNASVLCAREHAKPKQEGLNLRWFYTRNETLAGFPLQKPMFNKRGEKDFWNSHHSCPSTSVAYHYQLAYDNIRRSVSGWDLAGCDMRHRNVAWRLHQIWIASPAFRGVLASKELNVLYDWAHPNRQRIERPADTHRSIWKSNWASFSMLLVFGFK